MVSRYYAEKELLENGINSLPITTERLEAIITRKGFKIINYDTACKQHAEILTSLGVLSLADRTKAFTYSNKSEKIVFTKIGISANEKRLLLAHELGHIALHHMSDNVIAGYTPGGLIDDGQEDEANAFALELLAPVCILIRKHISSPKQISDITLLDEKRSRLVADEVRNHRKLTNLEIKLFNQFEASKKPHNRKIEFVAGAFLLIVIITAQFYLHTQITRNNSIPMNMTECPIVTVIPKLAEKDNYVFVTKSGERYHRPDCRHISNRSNVIQITTEQAQNSGYTPCKDCFSELYN